MLMAPKPGLADKMLKMELIWILCQQQFLYRCATCISSNISTLNHYLLSIWDLNVSVGSCIFICSVWQPCSQCRSTAEALVECVCVPDSVHLKPSTGAVKRDYHHICREHAIFYYDGWAGLWEEFKLWRYLIWVTNSSLQVSVEHIAFTSIHLVSSCVQWEKNYLVSLF